MTTTAVRIAITNATGGVRGSGNPFVDPPWTSGGLTVPSTADAARLVPAGDATVA
jgi:hypothetical protein